MAADTAALAIGPTIALTAAQATGATAALAAAVMAGWATVATACPRSPAHAAPCTASMVWGLALCRVTAVQNGPCEMHWQSSPAATITFCPTASVTCWSDGPAGCPVRMQLAGFGFEPSQHCADAVRLCAASLSELAPSDVIIRWACQR